jgi:hypothetical protein
MQVQVDYETETTVAAFPSPHLARQAAARLGDAHIGASMMPLPRGRYQLADARLGDEVAGVVRGACIGAPVGALLGALLAISGVGWWTLAIVCLAVIGALAGALVGGLVGSATRAHFDDDLAAALVVQQSHVAVGVVAHTNLLDGSTRRAYDILRESGARVFLDPTTLDLEDAEPPEAASATLSS